MSLDLNYLRDNLYYNRNQLRRLTRYSEYKRRALYRWLYFYLRRGDRIDRQYERQIRKAHESKYIRRNRIYRYLEVGTNKRALAYASEIITEDNAWTLLNDLFVATGIFLETARRKRLAGLLEEDELIELLEDIIALKEREIEVLSELHDRISELHPGRIDWANSIARAISFIRVRLERKRELIPPPPPPPPEVDVVQFLASLSIHCITGVAPNIDERHIEARAILELTKADFENTDNDKGESLLEEYVILLGYDEVLDCVEDEGKQFGVSIIEEFTLDQEDVEDYTFTARFELFDYDRDPPTLRFKHTLKGISLDWQQTNELLEKLEAVISGGYVDDYKGGKGIKGQDYKKHIWQDKDVPRPDIISEDGYIKKTDGAGISSTMSDIVPILVEHQPLGFEIDQPREFQKLKALFNMEFLSDSVDAYLSPSDRGLHMEAKDRSTNWNNRLYLGDCRGRLFFSEVRSQGYLCKDDVLFIGKKKCDKMRYRTKIDSKSLLSLPFTSKPPTLRRISRRRN